MYHVGFNTIPYIWRYIRSWHKWPAQKEATSCTRFYVQDWRWIGKIFYSNPCELILLHGFLRWYLYLFKISCRAEVVTSLHRSVTTTPGLTSAGCHLHRSSVWPLVGCAKSTVVWYISTFVQYISRRLTTFNPTNEESAWAQWGKNLIGKQKLTSQLSACDVTCVVSLDTNNQV